MRFKRLADEKQRESVAETDARERQEQTRSKRAMPETLEGQAPPQSRRLPALPLEWQSLARHIEAERAIETNEEYIDGFWQRLRERLGTEARSDAAVRAYLRRTFWRRWSLRTAAALAIILMLLAIESQRREAQVLRVRLFEMQRQIDALEASM